MRSEPPTEALPEAAPGATRDLVEAVELLGDLINENQEALLEDAALLPPEVDPYTHFNVPPGTQRSLFDVFENPAAEALPEEDEEEFEDIPEVPDMDTLKQELLADLNALIEVGLRRVTDSARLKLSQEFNQELIGSDRTDAVDESDAATWPSLSAAVGDILSRYGLADNDSNRFYQDLQSELHAILGTGLEQIRRNLEQVLQSRMSARAESQLQALSAPRERQYPDGLERPAANRDNPPDDFP